MLKKTIAFTIIALLLANTSVVYAGYAFVLSDDELDQVYAKGLNFDISQSFLGSRSETAGNMGNGRGVLSPIQPRSPVQSNNSANVQISPVQPGNPNSPESPNNPLGAQNPVAPVETLLPNSPLGAVGPVSPVDPSAPISPIDPAGSITPISPINPAGPVLPVGPDAPPVSPVGPVGPSAPVNVLMTPNSPEGTVTPIGPLALADKPNGPVAPVNPSAPSSPSAPAAPAQPAVILDVIGNGNGKIYSASATPGRAAANSEMGSYSFAPAASTGTNVVDISGAAQQQFGGIVNVNAAGSIVPVQINLTVLINSTVQNLESVNTLNMSNYTALQVQ